METKEEEEESGGIHAQAWFNRIKSKVKTLQRYLGVKAHVQSARKQERFWSICADIYAKLKRVCLGQCRLR